VANYKNFRNYSVYICILRLNYVEFCYKSQKILPPRRQERQEKSKAIYLYSLLLY